MKKTVILFLAFFLFVTPFILAAGQETTLSPVQIQAKMNDANWKIASGVLMTISGSIVLLLDLSYLALQLYDTMPKPEPALSQDSGYKYVISTETIIWMSVFGVVGAGLVGFGINNCVTGGEEQANLKKQMSITPFIYSGNGIDKYTYGLKMNFAF